MARSRLGSGVKRRRKTLVGESRPWGTMDHNLLMVIFKNLCDKELFFKTSLVCRSWRSAALETLFWENHHTLDLTFISVIIENKKFINSEPVPPEPTKRQKLKAMNSVVKKLFHQVEGNEPRSVTDLIFPFHHRFDSILDCLNYILLFVAIKSPGAKKIVLRDAYEVKKNCITEAFKLWKSLEEISIGNVYADNMTHIIERLSIDCKYLHTLTIDLNNFWKQEDGFWLTAHTAELISKNLQLRNFSIRGGFVDEEGVRIIMSKCENLLTLCFWGCRVLRGLPLYQCLETVTFEKQVTTSRGSECGANWRADFDYESQLLTCDEIITQMFSKDRPMKFFFPLPYCRFLCGCRNDSRPMFRYKNFRYAS